MTAKTAYAKSIKAARENAGLTQAELAGRLGVSPRTVARWEAGNRKITTEILEEVARDRGKIFLRVATTIKDGAT